MNCPVCKEVMIVLELDEVEIDFCLECKGIWLDGGELELLLENVEGKDAFLSSFTLDEQTKEKGRKCPICSRRMAKVLCGACGPGSNIRIDKCRKNDGIWFDEGELEAVFEAGTLDEGNKVLDLLKDMFGKKTGKASKK